MWKGYYGKEPFDLRLTALRMLYKLPLIAAAALLGAVVFGPPLRCSQAGAARPACTCG